MPWKNPPRKRSYSCPPELLLFLRERKGWTQSELASVVGYSNRLISKAEAGLPISCETIEHLAEALSTDAQEIHPEDLIADPVKLAEEYMAAVHTKGKGVVDAIQHFVDEDIVVRVAGDPTELPFAGEHCGIQAMRTMFDIFFSILEAPREHAFADDYTFIGEGNAVNMVGNSWIHPIGRPLDKPIMIAHRFVFCRGRLVLLEDVFDTMSGKKALEESQIDQSAIA